MPGISVVALSEIATDTLVERTMLSMSDAVASAGVGSAPVCGATLAVTVKLPVALGSSEGGLFHYGDDATIRVNLEALREYSGPDFSFTV